MKNCIKCEVELTDENWSQNQRGNWINKCMDCLKIEKREYHREWRKKNPGRSSAASLRCKNNLRLIDPIRSVAASVYSDSRKRAIKNSMQFDLTPKFVLDLMRQAKTCPYFGEPLTFQQGEKANMLASLDRIDSGKGYTTDNVMVISYLANLMKSHSSQDQLLQFARGVLSLSGLRTIEKLNGRAAK